MNAITATTKVCGRCREALPLSSFQRNAESRDGLHRWCSGCVKARADEIRLPFPIEKRCNACGRTKPAELFYKSRSRDGLQTVCKACYKNYDTPKKREGRIARYRGDWIRFALQRAEIRARKRGLLFDLTPADIVIPAVCPVLGIPLALGNGTFSDNSPSIDRHDNALGYVRGNIVVISWLANRIKSGCADPEIFERIAAYLRVGMKA